MSRINVLDEKVFNKIAAGEVVEKPASIVKEFIENSLDAKSTEILVEIENGGIDLIKVVDNGTGIHPEDVKSAFLPHSTSKVKTVEDLSNILTLGFRGEALASIASVSKVVMQTKQAEFDVGKRIEIDGGIIKNFEDSVISNGTIIEVKDIFYNIPARKKFLRKPRTEESEITNLIVRYILANPYVKFTYIVDNETIYKSNGTGLEDAIYLIYKKDTLQNLLKVDYKTDDVEISGFISKPIYTKSNRTYQTLIVNGRYIVNSLISTAIQNAYENTLMKGQFPFFVLNFNLPITSLDVNVHPNKLDVKFENTQKIYGLFFTAISKTLLNFDEIKTIENKLIFDKPFKRENNFFGKSFEEEKNESLTEKTINSQIKENENTETNNEFLNKLANKQDLIKTYESFAKKENVFCENPIMSQVFEKIMNDDKQNLEEVSLKTSENNELNTQIVTKQQVFENINASNYKIIGICFDTYILIEMQDKLFLFDQHACHERLNYDKFLENLNNKTLSIQTLLVPYIFSINSLESEFLEENIDVLKELGFDISLFGDNSFKINSIPSILNNINLQKFVNEILSNLTSLKKLSTIDLLKENLSQKACKASVKAGDKLTDKDIEILLNKMIENNMTLSCPHGRPACVEITKTELEKWFKRKV